MTDRKTTAAADPNDDNANSKAGVLAHDSDGTDTNMRQLDVTLPASNASFSLGRLEHDLKMLQSKWQAVEHEMSDRDEQLATLQQEFDSAQRENASILEEKQQIENELCERKSSAATINHRLKKLKSKNVELRVHLQELEDYIDARKEEWDKLTAQIRDYEDTIEGIGSSLDANGDVVAEKEEEKAALALRLMELERELAELKGRQTEREANQAELQHTLDDQSRELGSLNSEAIGLRKDIERLQKKLDRRDATVRSLKRDLKNYNRDSSALEDLLVSEKDTISDLQAKLTVANGRVAELEAEQERRDKNADELGVTIGELRERLRLSGPTTEKQELRITELEASLQASERREKELRGEAANAAMTLEEMSIKSAEHEIRAVEVQAVLLETQSDQKEVEKELEAQRELVHVLERELTDKQANLDILDRSADRLSAIGSEIRELDVRIDEHWCEQPEKQLEHAEDVFEQPDEVLLTAEELFADPEEMYERVIVAEGNGTDDPVRYPLNQRETTIGRGHKCDIRLNSKFISREHAKIRIEGSRVIIEDAGSTNGFLVNSRHMTRHTLVNGDKLKIGKSKFRYLNTSSA